MTETPALKPCPFCGAKQGDGQWKEPGIGASQDMDDAGEYIEEGRTWSVICPTCGASCSACCSSEAEAIAAWNKRSVGSEASGNSTGSIAPLSPLPSPPPVSEEVVEVVATTMFDRDYEGRVKWESIAETDAEAERRFEAQESYCMASREDFRQEARGAIEAYHKALKGGGRDGG